MNLSDVYRDNAEDCAFLAERAEDGEVKRALKRMEEAWILVSPGKTVREEEFRISILRIATQMAVEFDLKQ